MSNAIARKLEAIELKGNMRFADIANVLEVRPETVSRWNHGKAFPRPKTEKQLLELEFIIDLLSDLYEPAEARMWLFSRQRLLNNETPAELIQRDRVDEVLDLVHQMRDGTYL